MRQSTPDLYLRFLGPCIRVQLSLALLLVILSALFFFLDIDTSRWPTPIEFPRLASSFNLLLRSLIFLLVAVARSKIFSALSWVMVSFFGLVSRA
jgi:hypothetical protein